MKTYGKTTRSTNPTGTRSCSSVRRFLRNRHPRSESRTIGAFRCTYRTRTCDRRELGDGPSRVVFDTLSKDPSKIKDRLAYLTKTDDGRILKSSTMFVRGDNGTVEYIFSLNYDITALLAVESAVHDLITTEKESRLSDSDSDSVDDAQPQQIIHNVNDLLDSLIAQALSLVGKPVAAMNKDDKIAVVKFLNNAGAFLITKSGDKVASLLGISKFTLYNYMDAGNR